MKEVLPQIDTTNRADRYGAAWYQATTLAERRAFLQESTSRGATIPQAGMERAAQRLKQWKSQAPFNTSEQTFVQRLELDGLTEEDLLTLLAQSAEDIQACFATEPAWLAKFIKAFEQPDESALAGLPLDRLEDPRTRAMSLAIKPLLASGFAHLRAGIARLQKHYSRLPFHPQTISLLLLPRILEQLLTRFTKTLVLELNVARVQGRLHGETPEQRFDDFLQQLTHKEQMLTLLEEYPVLARQLVEATERWSTGTLELLQRLCADWDELCRTFSPESDPGFLSEIKEGAGDVHQSGRSVTILTWSSGLRLVYKPRSLAIDAHFQELLSWLNAHGCQPAFRTLKLLPKEAYGWCEYISPAACPSKEGVQRFYQRLGGYLALLYALEATDFHSENLLAAGEDPMLVDLESLFQPRINLDEGPENYGRMLFRYSVRRVGLLPQRIFLNEQGVGIDISGLAGQSGQLTPFAVATWKGQGTDEMRAVRERVEVKSNNEHRPTIQGQEIDTLEYENDIIAGFTTVYRLLLQQRDELLNVILPRFAHDEIRVLFRQTQQYVMIHEDSFHPNVLRDSLDRERIFDRLWIGVEQRPHLLRLLKAERADLWDGDIPRFSTHPASRNIFTARGETIADFFPESGLDLSRKCIQHLSEQDLERQTWVIHASFASLALNAAHTMSKTGIQLLPASSPVTREQLLVEAMTIGSRIEQLALIQQDLVGWQVLNLVGGQEWRPVPAGPDLYNGLPGIAFFLAYLGMLSGEERYTNLARLTLKTLQTVVLDHKHLWQKARIGAYDGVGSLIYLLTHLGTIWQEPELYREAQEIVEILPRLIDEDGYFDVMSGAPSCIAALLSLHTFAPSESILAAAVQCGDHLLSHALSMPQGIAWSPTQEDPPLAGLSHGNAGVALNLLRLAAACKEERFRQAAFEALAYERSLYSSEKRNWKDLRILPPALDTGKSERYMTAWCHGAVGVGLARLASLPYHDDAAIREEIEAAIQTTFAEGFGKNHSLCHGDMSSLEFLFSAAQLFPDTCPREKVEALQASILDSMKNHGWRSGVPMSIETPGLMVGLAGTGYALLRQIDPERIPSVLVLDPPMRERIQQSAIA